MFQKLDNILQGFPVIIAYLFGSQAVGRSGPLSDLDIAVYVNSSLEASDRFDLKLRLSSLLSSTSGRTADVVILNDAPIQLSYEVIKSGKVILCRDSELRVELETRILRKYLDRRYYDKRRAEQTLARMTSGGRAILS